MNCDSRVEIENNDELMDQILEKSNDFAKSLEILYINLIDVILAEIDVVKNENKS